jgi:aminopeptidase YwaD
LGCSVEAGLVQAATVEQLEELDAQGKIILLHGDIAKEQLMPKNFVFWNPEEHQRIVAALERSGAAALVCATGRNSALAGGAYPFPLVEDGDFDVPSVYMTEEEGVRLLPAVGKTARLRSLSRRLRGSGENLVATRGHSGAERIVVTAHIDAKKGTPGAIDNATGVIVLLLLARLLKQRQGGRRVEIVAFNGEDYYAVPGQMAWIRANEGKFEDIYLNINIDGAGYVEGDTAFSFYGVPEHVKQAADQALRGFPGTREGGQWPQGDHSIFVQYGRPAIAVSSSWFTENIDGQDITHTPKDNPGIVDCAKVVEAAEAIASLITAL